MGVLVKGILVSVITSIIQGFLHPDIGGTKRKQDMLGPDTRLDLMSSLYIIEILHLFQGLIKQNSLTQTNPHKRSPQFHSNLVFFLLSTPQNFPFVIFIFYFCLNMGVCTYKTINDQQYYLSSADSFLICWRSPKPSQKVFEIRFNFEACFSTGSSTAQSIKERPLCRAYQISIRLYQMEIDTPLVEICEQIQGAFEMAHTLNCSKVQFVQPSFETEKNVRVVFGEIVRMLLYFQQKGMFLGQRKIYLNWSSLHQRNTIAQISRSWKI